jgi:hypothetical protein
VSGAPAPGSIVVRLNGRFRAYAGVWDDQDLNRTGIPTTTYTLTPTTISVMGANGKPVTANVYTYTRSTTVSNNKQSNYGMTEYTRLYPGFDGVTAGGIKYGASVEIRQDNPVAPGGGVNGSVSGADRARGGLYVRREWGYIGTDELGVLRFGTEDSPSSLYLTGTFENFNDGGWNGDVWYGLATGAQLVWPFADSGYYYPENRIVYLSPRYHGFDFGVSWQPGTGNASIYDGNCAAAATSGTIGTSPITVPATSGYDYGGVGCDRLSSTSVSAESARSRNVIDAVLRYRAVFGAVGMVATGGYIGGGHVAYSGAPYVTSVSSTTHQALYTKPVTYNGLSVGDFGFAMTYGGLQVGGHYQFGRFNNAAATGAGAAFSTVPVGGKGGDAWIAGLSYTIGPVILGAAYLDVDSQGAFAYQAGATPADSKVAAGLGQRRESGVQAGGTLKVAPGLGMFLSYLWDERKQAGYDFSSGLIGSSDNNKIRAQAATLGTSLTW